MNVLILGTCRPGHAIAKDMGYQVTLFIKSSEVKDPDTKFGYKNLFIFSDDATDESIRAAAELLHLESPFNAVVCFNDNMQSVGIDIADKLNLWFPITRDILSLVFEKNKCREKVAAAGIENVVYSTVTSLEESRNFVRKLSKPVIVKPLAGSGSRGVRRVENLSEINSVIEALQQEGCDFPLLIEEFLTGKEFSVEAFSVGGVHHILSITEKFKDPDSFIEFGHVMPAEIKEEGQVKHFVNQVLNAIGITDGASHTEVIVGKDKVSLVETHTRMGGDNIDDLIELTTGLNVYKLIIQQALRQELDLSLPLFEQQQYAASYFLVPTNHDEQIIAKIDGEKRAKNSAGIKRVMLFKGPGDSVIKAKSSFDRLALAVATGTSREAAINNAKLALNEIKLTMQVAPA
jgi:biotin carboxylase